MINRYSLGEMQTEVPKSHKTLFLCPFENYRATDLLCIPSIYVRIGLLHVGR